MADNLPTTSTKVTEYERFSQALLERREEIAAFLAGTEIGADDFIATVLHAVARKPELLQADRRSLILSSLDCAKDGLLSDGREAALVIFKAKVKTSRGEEWIAKVQYMPMIAGIYKRMWNSEGVESLSCHPVHENDEFEHILGAVETVIHKRPKLGTKRGAVIGVYAIATLKSGLRMFEVMDRDEIEQTRSISRTRDSGPWRDWYGEMCKKTVVRRLSKRLPLSAKLRALMRRDDNFYDLEGEAERLEETAPQPKIARQPGQSKTIARLVAAHKNETQQKPAAQPDPHTAEQADDQDRREADEQNRARVLDEFNAQATAPKEEDDFHPHDDQTETDEPKDDPAIDLPVFLRRSVVEPEAPQLEPEAPQLEYTVGLGPFRVKGRVDWMKWARAFNKVLALVENVDLVPFVEANNELLQTVSVANENAHKTIIAALASRGVKFNRAGQ